MYTTEKLEKMGKVELRAACKELGIKGYSKLPVAKMRTAITVAQIRSSGNDEEAAEPEVVATPATPADRVNGVNGKSRPKAGGKCAAVWDYLDKHPGTTLKEIKAVAEKKGWSVGNAACELYAHRKFNGITGRVKK